MWRISRLIIKWLFPSAWNPLRSQFISLRIIHTGFTVVDGQHVVYYLFLSWRIRNLSSSHADLLGAPLRQRHRARSASRLVVNWENSGDDEGRYSVWATLVHYRLPGGEREASTWRCEERLGHTELCKIWFVPCHPFFFFLIGHFLDKCGMVWVELVDCEVLISVFCSVFREDNQLKTEGSISSWQLDST